eukprot:CCRYP_017242-RB/>CCRYP_017242-RB protein AED:0.48 eAED:0.48 QI:0/0/0/1/1/1/2/0/137
MCAGVVHPTTGETITSYKKLIACPLLRDVWTTAFGKEFEILHKGTRKQVKNIPKDRTVTYGRVVVDYRPQKGDPNRVRITAGGNLIKDYPGELTTRRRTSLHPRFCGTVSSAQQVQSSWALTSRVSTSRQCWTAQNT